ncbi:MAG: DNA-binding protein [Peptococcaceae bacterium]|nr:MAG: DNA-binding protein [Peptococcaceae bacterium]
MGKEMFTIREVAAEYGRNPETVRRWVWTGKLPAKKLGNQLFIHKKDLLKLKREERDKPEKNPDFLKRAQALQEKIRARTKTDFDPSLLIEESRTRSFSGEDLY